MLSREQKSFIREKFETLINSFHNKVEREKNPKKFFSEINADTLHITPLLLSQIDETTTAQTEIDKYIKYLILLEEAKPNQALATVFEQVGKTSTTSSGLHENPEAHEQLYYRLILSDFRHLQSVLQTSLAKKLNQSSMTEECIIKNLELMQIALKEIPILKSAVNSRAYQEIFTDVALNLKSINYLQLLDHEKLYAMYLALACDNTYVISELIGLVDDFTESDFIGDKEQKQLALVMAMLLGEKYMGSNDIFESSKIDSDLLQQKGKELLEMLGEAGNLDAVKFLVSQYEKYDLVSRVPEDAGGLFCRAGIGGHQDIVDYIWQYCCTQKKQHMLLPESQKPVFFDGLAFNGRVEMIKFLLDNYYDENERANLVEDELSFTFSNLCEAGHTDVITYMWEQCDPLNCQSFIHQKDFLTVCAHGNENLMVFLWDKFTDVDKRQLIQSSVVKNLAPAHSRALGLEAEITLSAGGLSA